MKRERSARRRAVWGVFLIGLGVVFLLTRLDIIDFHLWRPWWPLILIAMGLVWMVAPGRPRQIASGLSFVLIGLWFTACTQHWYGFTYRTAWPLLVVVAGVEMVFTAVLDRVGPKWKEEHHA